MKNRGALAELQRSARAWDALATRDAMWASCTNGRLHGRWDARSFMLTGFREVAWISAHAREIGALPPSVEIAADFGCGPGRLLGGLAAFSSNVIGIDVSSVMLRLAQRNYADDPRVSFAPTLDVVGAGVVDLVYSTFVLQHLVDELRWRAWRQFAEALRPGGVAIFQFPEHPRKTPLGLPWQVLPRQLLASIQRHVLRYPAAMPMRWATNVPLSEELTAAGFRSCAVVKGLQYSPHWVDAWHIVQK